LVKTRKTNTERESRQQRRRKLQELGSMLENSKIGRGNRICVQWEKRTVTFGEMARK